MAKAKKDEFVLQGLSILHGVRDHGMNVLADVRATQYPSNCSTLIYHSFTMHDPTGRYYPVIPEETLKAFAYHLADRAHFEGGYTYCLATLLERGQKIWIDALKAAGWEEVPQLTGVNHRTNNSLVTVVHHSYNPDGYEREQDLDIDDGYGDLDDDV